MFVPRSKTLRGTLTVDAPVERAFPLFSPSGERLWVPGWDPEVLDPQGADWEEEMLFRTRDEHGEAVWVITRLDRAAHEVTYHRVEPGRYVARVEVRCLPGDSGTKVETSYRFVGLSDAGNAEIDAMTDADYAAKMERWAGWIRGVAGRF